MSDLDTPPDSQPESDNAKGNLSIPPQLIEYIPEEKRGEFSREYILHIEQYSGIIPHPSIVGRWEEILPGSAERALTIAEQHHSSRIDMENAMLQHLIYRERLSMIFYFVIALVMIIGGIFIVLSGLSTVGLVALAAPVATIAGAFIFNHTGRRSKRD